MNDNSSITLHSMSEAKWYNQWLLNQFKLYLRGDILEVGCGIGNFTELLADYGKVWALDISDKYIKFTRQKLNGKATVGIGDIEKGKYFFEDQKFDSIVCLNVLEHIKNDQAALYNLLKLLKKNGKLILLIPAHQFLYGKIDRSIDHFRRYSKKEIIKEMEKIGFRINKSRRFNILGALGWFIAGRIIKDTKVSRGNIRLFNLLAPVFLRLEKLLEPPVGISILIIAQKND